MTPLAVLLLVGALGAVVGSGVTTWALRSVDQHRTFDRHSRCDSCRRPLGFVATAPIVSYIALAGRCRGCGDRIHPAHPVGEALGLVAGVAIVFVALDWRVVVLALLASALLAAAVIDARTRILPDRLVGVVALAGLVLSISKGLDQLVFGLAAAGVTAVVFLLLRRGWSRLRGEVGLGAGDVKLFCALALWLGLATPWMVLGAAVSAMVLVAIRGRGDGRIAFGPMIAASGFVLGLVVESGTWSGL